MDRNSGVAGFAMIFRRRRNREARAEAAAMAESIGLQVIKRAPDQLRALVDVPDRFEVTGPSGQRYQVVVDACPEDREGKILRVSVAVDGGSVSPIFPVGWGDSVAIEE
jgi:hypothetical protein